MSEPAPAPPHPQPCDPPRTGDLPRPSLLGDLREIVRELWESRFLLYQLTLRDLRIRYKQAVMGFGWAVLMPVLIVFAGVIVRTAMQRLSGTPLDERVLAGVAIKALPWAFFVGAIGFANQALTRNVALVTKTYFPREVLPLSAVLAQGIDTLLGAAFLALVLPWLDVQLGWPVLWVPVLALLLFLFTCGGALLVSSTNLFFRDVRYLVQVVLTFGIFFTPVFFEPAMFGSRGAELMMLNPLSPLIEGVRLAMVEGHDLSKPLSMLHGGELLTVWSPLYLLYSAAWALGGVTLCALLFHRLEFLFAEYV